ncbi:MAG TPA: DUF4340 domain-containing protein [Verrucomicrobiae bacterium]|nr:DUF4340 domain-containing protein [Verrucomicrobiae bacterium]
MNRKQLVTLIVLVIILGGVGWFIHQRQQNANSLAGAGIGKKLLGKDFPVNDVAHIDLKQGTNEVNLDKTNDLWRVRQRADYPANFSQISDFLLKAKDLKVIQTEDVGPSQLSRLYLTATDGSNSAEVVTFKDEKGKVINTLWLGKKHMRKSNQPSPEFGGMDDEGFPDGRYVRVGDAGPVAVISEAFANIEPAPEQWLNKDFVKIDRPKTISVQFPTATNSWKLTRESESADWKLADAKAGEQLDSSKASSVESPLSSASFNDVATPDKASEFGLSKPTVLTVSTFDGLTYTVNVGAKTNDIYAMTLKVQSPAPKARVPGKDEKPADKARLDKEFADQQKQIADKAAQAKACENWVYLVSSWTLDPVLKNRSDLLAEKKEEPKKTAAADKAAPDVTQTAAAGSSPASKN